ncbi:MAG: hypothetical protein ACXW36_10660, partial [Nitrospira sp.]
ISYEDLAAERFKISLNALFLTSRRWGKNPSTTAFSRSRDVRRRQQPFPHVAQHTFLAALTAGA